MTARAAAKSKPPKPNDEIRFRGIPEVLTLRLMLQVKAAAAQTAEQHRLILVETLRQMAKSLHSTKRSSVPVVPVAGVLELNHKVRDELASVIGGLADAFSWHRRGFAVLLHALSNQIEGHDPFFALASSTRRAQP